LTTLAALQVPRTLYQDGGIPPDMTLGETQTSMRHTNKSKVEVYIPEIFRISYNLCSRLRLRLGGRFKVSDQASQKPLLKQAATISLGSEPSGFVVTVVAANLTVSDRYRLIGK
jgi:hypothetical protein